MEKKDSVKKKFDKRCESMIKNIISKRSTVKSEVYKQKDPKKYHKLIHTVIENYDLLLDITKKNNFMVDTPELAAINCYQILNRKIKNTRFLKKFLATLGDRKLKFTRKPMFVRVNNLKSGDIVELKQYNPMETQVKGVYEINNIKNVNELDSFKNSKFVLQNVASCLPPYILNPEKNSTIIDTCAAPGNKTSQLADIMENTGKIYAYEMDERRFKVLEERLKNYGVKNTECINQDFLASDPKEIKGVKYILCDPSCSGSGIHLDFEEDKERITRLQEFQISILQHAITFGPEKIIYSTCSKNVEEGEEVIKTILEECDEYEVEDISRFWDESGYEGYDFSEKVIRCTGDDENGAVGFFIALLSKKSN